MKHLLFLLLFLCSTSVFAQDVIVKKDGSTALCRVVELTESEIIYKKWSDLNGSNYVMERSVASTINYENGKKINLSETTNLYQPGNQNDGIQRYNDKALLGLDADYQRGLMKVKKLKRTAWIGGISLFAAGAILCAVYPSTNEPKSTWKGGGYVDENNYKTECLIVGVALAGTGAIWTTAFLIAANNQQKKLDNFITNAPLLNHEFDFNNGKTLMTSIDVLKYNYTQQPTLGIGLRYNF